MGDSAVSMTLWPGPGPCPAPAPAPTRTRQPTPAMARATAEAIVDPETGETLYEFVTSPPPSPPRRRPIPSSHPISGLTCSIPSPDEMPPPLPAFYGMIFFLVMICNYFKINLINSYDFIFQHIHLSHLLYLMDTHQRLIFRCRVPTRLRPDCRTRCSSHSRSSCSRRSRCPRYSGAASPTRLRGRSEDWRTRRSPRSCCSSSRTSRSRCPRCSRSRCSRSRLDASR